MLVVLRVGVGRLRAPLGLAAEADEVLARPLVAREDARGQGQLGAHVGDGHALGEREGGHPGAGVLEDLPAAAAHREPAEQLEDDVLRRHPGGERAGEPYADHGGHGEVVRAAPHGHRHVETAGADGEHPGRATQRRVAVGTEQRFPRSGETLQVHLMADAIAGLGKDGPVASRGCLHVPVVVGIARIDLVDVVVDVGHRSPGHHPREPHGLELEKGPGPVGVRQQNLVDGDPDFLADYRLAGDEALLDELAREAAAHPQRWPRGTQARARGPTYSARGRMRRLSSCCSMMLAVHPATRPAAMTGVKRSTGMPRE